MAKPTTITKDMIIEAAFEIVRSGGQKMLSARNVAKKIGCSTQPIYWTYRNMEMLKQDIILKIENFMNAEIKSFDKYDTPDLNIGLGYIYLAHKEPNLFHEYYLNNVKNITFNEMIPAGFSKNSDNTASNQMTERWISIHGMASLVASRIMTYDEDTIEKMVFTIFE